MSSDFFSSFVKNLALQKENPRHKHYPQNAGDCKNNRVVNRKNQNSLRSVYVDKARKPYFLKEQNQKLKQGEKPPQNQKIQIQNIQSLAVRVL